GRAGSGPGHEPDQPAPLNAERRRGRARHRPRALNYFISLILMLRKWISAPSDCQPIGPSVSSLFPELIFVPLTLASMAPSALQTISVVFHSPTLCRALSRASLSNLGSCPLTPRKSSWAWFLFMPWTSTHLGQTLCGSWMWTRQPLLPLNFSSSSRP